MPRGVLKALVALAVVVAPSLVVLPAHPSVVAVDDAVIRAVTWNMCGWKIQDACRYPSIAAKAAETKKVMDLRDANVVLLQEACQAHVAELARLLGPEWTLHATPYMRWVDDSTSRPIWCGDDHPGSAAAEAYGSVNVVVGIKEAGIPASAKTVEYLPGFLGAGRWRHPLLCVTSVSVAVRACTTHMTWPKEWNSTDSQYEEQNIRRAQAARIVEVLGQDPLAVIGGDFNAGPPDGPVHPLPELAVMYASFRECDQAVYGDQRAGRATNGGYRLDYIFGKGTWTSCHVEPKPYRDDPNGRRYMSDHQAVAGELVRAPE
ncbi:endonuclease/exonuclease/phosphatase family protein [Plantactinospora sp. B6F1]|uniref:endonuclease/exonuclease/phosphatase family protein n=1 Tax=Plantactinospora sp. B6F1 TaxID=3158971 RepID=UPI0032D95BDF